jgi:hypothetical protein
MSKRRAGILPSWQRGIFLTFPRPPIQRAGKSADPFGITSDGIDLSHRHDHTGTKRSVVAIALRKHTQHKVARSHAQ